MEAAQLFLYCMLDVEAVFNAYACFEEYTSGQSLSRSFSALSLPNGMQEAVTTPCAMLGG